MLGTSGISSKFENRNDSISLPSHSPINSMSGEEFWVNVASRQTKGWGKYKYGETEQSYNGPWTYEIVVRWPPHGKTIHEVV